MSPLVLFVLGGLAGLFSGGVIADAIVTRRRKYVGLLTVHGDGTTTYYHRTALRLPPGDYSLWTSKP